MLDAIVFDLDGTLWDACDSMTISWNRTLAACGRSPLTAQAMRATMGGTAEQLARQLFPDLPLSQGVALFRRCVREECGYLRDHGGTLFPRVRETLERLSRRYALTIVSNCEEGYIEAFLEHYGLASLFIDHDCYGHTRLPKGETIRLLLQRHTFAAAVYVGDTEGDRVSATQAGLPFIFARYGFGDVSAYDAVIDRFDQLPSVLNAWTQQETE